MVGRPKKKFTDKQIKEIGNYALVGCQNNTIATLIEIPVNTLTRHFGNFLTKKRAERKYKLKQAQFDKAVISKDTGMLCFLGKNELGQSDRQNLDLNFSFSDFVKAVNGNK